MGCQARLQVIGMACVIGTVSAAENVDVEAHRRWRSSSFDKLSPMRGVARGGRRSGKGTGGVRALGVRGGGGGVGGRCGRGGGGGGGAGGAGVGGGGGGAGGDPGGGAPPRARSRRERRRCR